LYWSKDRQQSRSKYGARKPVVELLKQVKNKLSNLKKINIMSRRISKKTFSKRDSKYDNLLVSLLVNRILKVEKRLAKKNCL
jgi:hypothetical protein